MTGSNNGLPTLSEVMAGIAAYPTWPAHEPLAGNCQAILDASSSGDPVHQPAHYQADNGIECIDAIRAALGREGFIAYCRGNSLKYAWRAGKKGCAAEDMAKAAKYAGWAAKA